MAKYENPNMTLSEAKVGERRKHGKWKKAYLEHEAFEIRPTVVYCSECNLVGYWEPNYCPNCGARMVTDDV